MCEFFAEYQEGGSYSSLSCAVCNISRASGARGFVFLSHFISLYIYVLLSSLGFWAAMNFKHFCNWCSAVYSRLHNEKQTISGQVQETPVFLNSRTFYHLLLEKHFFLFLAMKCVSNGNISLEYDYTENSRCPFISSLRTYPTYPSTPETL